MPQLPLRKTKVTNGQPTLFLNVYNPSKIAAEFEEILQENNQGDHVLKSHFYAMIKQLKKFVEEQYQKGQLDVFDGGKIVRACSKLSKKIASNSLQLADIDKFYQSLENLQVPSTVRASCAALGLALVCLLGAMMLNASFPLLITTAVVGAGIGYFISFVLQLKNHPIHQVAEAAKPFAL